jgi:hypothetical protein
MEAQPRSNDPAGFWLTRVSTSGNISASTHWQLGNTRKSILRQAYDAVEEEDRIQFIRALDGSSGEHTNIQNAAAGFIAEWQKAANDLTGTEVLRSEHA